MNRWNSEPENPNRGGPGNPNVTGDVNYHENGKKNDESYTKKKTVEGKDFDEDFTPRQRLEMLNGKMEKVKKQARRTLREISETNGTVNNEPLKEVLDSIEGAGNALAKAQRLAEETTPQGLSKNFQKGNQSEEVRDDDEYSRSGNADATVSKEKKRDQEREHNREEISPDW